MIAAPKFPSLWKLHCRDHSVSRTCTSLGEAVVSREETSACTWRSLRGMDPSTYAKTAEITSGRAHAQQGFTATCKDWYFERKQRVTEGIGLAHESVER
jgi:hypothetical protein